MGWTAGSNSKTNYLHAAWSEITVSGDGIVYVARQSGVFYVLDGRTGTLLSSVQPNYAAASTPAIAPGLVAIATPSKLAVFITSAEGESLGEKSQADSGGTTELRNGGPNASRWMVIGGRSRGGIVVRTGFSMKSKESGRLSFAALVQEEEQREDRLRFTKLLGDGPETGWVSLKFKESPLLLQPFRSSGDWKKWQLRHTKDSGYLDKILYFEVWQGGAGGDRDLGRIQTLLDKNADPNGYTFEDGDRVIHVTAGRGSTNLVRMMIDAKADVNVPGCFGMTPLDRCSYQPTEYWRGWHPEIQDLVRAASNR